MAEIKRRGEGKKEEIYVSTVLPNGLAVAGSVNRGEVVAKLFGNREKDKSDDVEAVQIRLIGRENIADVRDCLTALLEQADAMEVIEEMTSDDKPKFMGIDPAIMPTEAEMRQAADRLLGMYGHAPIKAAPPPIAGEVRYKGMTSPDHILDAVAQAGIKFP